MITLLLYCAASFTVGVLTMVLHMLHLNRKYERFVEDEVEYFECTQQPVK